MNTLNLIRNPLLIGYKGQIGSFLLQGLLSAMPKALNIWCVDAAETDNEVRQRIKKSDFIFLCVPIDQTLPWIEKHKRLLQNDKILVEQTSLKENILSSPILDGIRVISMHILFRPSQTPNIDDRKVGMVLPCPHGGNGVTWSPPEFAEDIKTITQSEIVWFNNVRLHDEEMALKQALLHRTILVLADMFDKCEASTFISKKITELRDRICAGDMQLYNAIQANPHLQTKLNEFDVRFRDFNMEKLWKPKTK